MKTHCTLIKMATILLCLFTTTLTLNATGTEKDSNPPFEYKWYRDLDNDGYGDPDDAISALSQPEGYVSNSGDCNDDNPVINPGMTEICNGIDDNCDGNIDEGVVPTWYKDEDNDRYSDGATIEQCTEPPGYKLAANLISMATDCDDKNPTIHPGAFEVCNEKDDNCNGQTDEGVTIKWYPDFDNDFFSTGTFIEQCTRPAGHKRDDELANTDGDCDDMDADVNPGKLEICNGKDDNCDGTIDEGVKTSWYPDFDNDGYSLGLGSGIESCTRPTGHKHQGELISTDGDCDDSNPNVNAGANEICNGIDDNCNSQTDEGVMITWYPDMDGDGFTPGGGTLEQCTRPNGYKIASELVNMLADCDDTDGNVNPDELEVCNQVDDNCNGQINEGLEQTWYRDLDNDDYYDGTTVEACSRPAGYRPFNQLAGTEVDCDDNNPTINPGAPEVCNAIDDNCNNQINEGIIQTWYKDADNDNFSDGTLIQDCQQPSGYKLLPNLLGTNDCDDDNPAINPNHPEVCNNIDDNCNGQINEGIISTWYKDIDNDNYSDGTNMQDCQRPSGYKLLAELSGSDIDCDDDNPAINPGEAEVCNSIDDNCNGQINEGILSTWYKDIDNDNYSDGTNMQDCQRPSGYKLLAELSGSDIDCDDDNPAINPGEEEVCNSIDDNCNGQINEGLIRTWYKDIDNDGYSDGQNVTQCNQLPGFKLPENLLQIEGDCNDDNPAVHPNAIEICDALDNNCNGLGDNSDPLLVDNETPVASCNSIEVDLDINGEIEVAIEEVFDQPGSFDNCGLVNPVSLSKSLFTCADIGINYPTLFVNDGNGNNAQCTGIIRVKDTMKPQVTCKTATISLNYFGEVEVPPTEVFEEGYDNCGNFYLTLEPNYFTCEELGPNFVTLYSEDDHENVNFCHSSITIIDDIAPDIYCKPHTVYLDENGEGTMVPSDVYLDSYDNCGTVNLVSVLPNTFDCGDLNNLGAENIVELTVNDGNGNQSACTAEVTVVDVIPPVPVCKPIVYELDATGLFVVPPVDLFNGGWDNCNVLNPQSASPASFDCDEVGVNPIVLTVNDGNGNTGTCETTVTILAGPYFTWFKDFDGDDWSDGTPVIEQCEQPLGYDLAMNLISLSGDCNDMDPFINPDRAETCNSTDDDCDGLVDEVLVTDISVSNVSSCNDRSTSNPSDDTFTADVTIVYEDIPSVGTLNLSGDGSASVSVSEVSGTSHTFYGVEMSADGTGISLTAVFTVATNCVYTEDDLAYAPISCSPCDILSLSVANMGNCDPQGNSDPSDDTFTADVTVTFYNAPAYGTLDLSGDGTASVDVSGLGIGTHTFTGVEFMADGTQMDLTASFSANGACNFNNSTSGLAMASCCNVTINEITATPESCEGVSDGSILIDATGTGTLLYSIDGGQNYSLSNEFTNLAPGTVEVIAQVQAQGCTDEESAIINAGNPIQVWYKDLDGDGYTDGTTIMSCSQPEGYLANATPGDCDDNDANQFPGQIWYEDLDGDGYGTGDPFVACIRPAGCYVASELSAIAGDCDDDDPDINPASPEICNGLDDDCDSEIDEGTSGGMTWTGNVSLNNQTEVNNWISCYSVIDGNLSIKNSGINDLTPLANLSSVTGDVLIKSTNLVDLTGLENLTSIGGELKIQSNNDLISLSGLGSVVSVGDDLYVYFNNDLTNCCAIHDLLLNGGIGGGITIMRNETGCDNQSQIENACSGGSNMVAPTNNGIQGTNAIGSELAPAENSNSTIAPNLNYEQNEMVVEQLTVSPNPTDGLIKVSLPVLPNNGVLRLTDLSGKMLMEHSVGKDLGWMEMDLTGYEKGVYLIMLNVDGLETQTKRVILD